jgi:hypothetical protein
MTQLDQITFIYIKNLRQKILLPVKKRAWKKAKKWLFEPMPNVKIAHFIYEK